MNENYELQCYLGAFAPAASVRANGAGGGGRGGFGRRPQTPPAPPPPVLSRPSPARPVTQPRSVVRPSVPVSMSIPLQAPDLQQTFTREQLYTMRERARQRDMEVSTPQTSEGGDGFDAEAEAIATDSQNIRRAVEDARAGVGMPKPGAPVTPDTGQAGNLLIAAIAAYLLFGG